MTDEEDSLGFLVNDIIGLWPGPVSYQVSGQMKVTRDRL